MKLEQSYQLHGSLNDSQELLGPQLENNRINMKYKEMELQGQCKLLSISPIRFVGWKFALFILSNVFVFIPLLLVFWYQKMKRIFYYDFCSLEQATHVYIVNYDQSITICQLASKTFMINEKVNRFYRYFTNRYIQYIIDEQQTVRISVFDYKKRIKSIFQSKQSGSLTQAQANDLLNTYGPGTMILNKITYSKIFLDIILLPLNMFLIFTILYLFFAVVYYYFSAVLFVVFTVGLIANVFQTMRLNRKIQAMAFSELFLDVLRQGKVVKLSSLQIVPGDIVFLKDAKEGQEGIKIPFQGVILQGNALINECALTGQSVPIVKKGDTIQNYLNSSKEIDKNSIVFEGTTIIQVNDKKRMSKFEQYRQKHGIPVCVIRTNFTTSKGQLIRLILFRRQGKNIFQQQSLRFLFYLGIFGIIIYIAMCIQLRQYLLPVDYVYRFIDTIILVIPGGIPVSMTFGILYAVQRLENQKMFCVVPNKVIDGGIVNLCCFDKTGTLTQDYMDFQLVVPAKNARFDHPILNNQQSFKKMLSDSHNASNENNYNDILINMASNHSITKIQSTSKLIGDPMQIKMFQFGKFTLNQSISDPDVVFGFESDRRHSGKVLRRFQFDFDLQRMSVITQSSHKQGYKIYAKGSPQMMSLIMNKQSIPANFLQTINEYASNGFRILAIASRPIQKSLIKTINRSQAEQDLIFNGLQVFQNKLKPQTKQAISDLCNAEIKSIMITGDNTLTGSNISYECKISNQDRGMLIVDLLDEQYLTATRFYYKNNYEQNDTQTVINQDFCEIKFKTNQKKKAKSDYIQKCKIADGQQFMQKMSSRAQRTNSQLCITGRAFNQLFQGPVNQISQNKARFMNNATVFARTKPNDKAKIVMVYQHMKNKVSMCGDGANDCGALKQADIGLSLSQSQASMSAPFTSQITNISSMVQLIKQCRCGLATNVSLFNIMAIYSLLMFTMTVIGGYFLQFPRPFQFLYQDLCLNFGFIIVLGYTKTAKVLTPQRPSCSLLSFYNILQIVVMFLWQMIAQIIVLVIYAQIQPQYNVIGGRENAIANYQQVQSLRTAGTQIDIVFLTTTNFYVASIIAFNINKPWRQYFFTNIPFVILIILSVTYNQIMIFWKEATWEQFLNQAMLPDYKDRWLIFGISAGFSFLMIFTQKVILEPLTSYCRRKNPQNY